MNTVIIRVVCAVAFVLFAPIIGGLLDGFDRVISARMQGRKGPSVLQPFYDIKKLLEKQFLSANKIQLLMILTYTTFTILTGVLFFSGFDMLMCIFALSTAEMFLVLASTSTHSPFSTQGTHRELMQMMATEPMLLIAAVGFYLANGSFNVSEMFHVNVPTVAFTPGIFIGYIFILTVKLRKSPFDLSTAHHAHQEVVKGVTTEMVGIEYAAVTLAEWYETVFLIGITGLFFINSNPISIAVAVVAILVVYFVEILIDNASARVKWQLMLRMVWGVTIVCGGLNIFILELIYR